MAAVFLAVHLVRLPPTLEDLDSVNFALGVRDFDIRRHQPHPPGYPIYTALGKISTRVLQADASGAASRGLAVWGAIGGALAVFPLFALFRRLEGRDRLALLATIVTATAPLFWFTANRPLSDMTGLAVVLAMQAVAVMAWVRQRDVDAGRASVRRLVLAAAALAGFAIGVRSQTFLLTLPLLGLVLLDPRVPASRRVPGRALAAFAAGVLVWALPLVMVVGGVRAYVDAVGVQGAEDFSDAAMLWTRPNARVLLYALRNSFVLPWATVPLAAVVLSLAAVGVGVLARRSRAAVLLLAATTLPYAAFHLLFQEAVHGKYALPLVPPVAYLLVVGIDALATAIARRRTLLTEGISFAAVASIVAASLWIATPALAQYGTTPSPIFQALADIKERARTSNVRPVIITHREAKRILEWPDLNLPGEVLPTERSHEWMAAVRYWLDGGREPVWFLARPERTDLALIDPARRVLAGQYRRAFDASVFTGAARPNGIDWYAITSPGWFLDRGWSLTPEIAGVTTADGLGPHLQPVLGYIARRHDQAVLMIGGIVGDGAPRPANAPPVHLRVAIDDRAVLEWDQVETWFLRRAVLPAGALSGDDAFARVSVRASNDGAPIQAKLEQFDLQPLDALVWGFDAGWLEPEYDPARELTWRWSSGKATFNIHHPGHDVTIRLRGDSPLKYFDAPPHVTVTAGARRLAEFRPDREFVQEIVVPAAALAAAQGLVVLETDRTFQPEGDPRVLGLRFFEISIK
jgi:hypothetical protein